MWKSKLEAARTGKNQEQKIKYRKLWRLLNVRQRQNPAILGTETDPGSRRWTLACICRSWVSKLEKCRPDISWCIGNFFTFGEAPQFPLLSCVSLYRTHLQARQGLGGKVRGKWSNPPSTPSPSYETIQEKKNYELLYSFVFWLYKC